MSDLAMAYHMKKKMAKGGMAEPMKEACKHNSMDCPECHGGMMAAGGDVHPDDDDLVMRIMKKRYAKGGEVEPVADFESNDFDVLDKEPPEEFHETGANSGDEIGDEQEDEDEKDVVSRVMKSRKKKDKMPRLA